MSLFHSPPTCGALASSRTCCELWMIALTHTHLPHKNTQPHLWPVSSRSRLSGLSPFLGDDDNETLNNILACQWNFEEEEFTDVSEEAKDFITRLLVKSKSWRMSAAESLRHPWLSDRSLHYRLNMKVLWKLSVLLPLWKRKRWIDKLLSVHCLTLQKNKCHSTHAPPPKSKTGMLKLKNDQCFHPKHGRSTSYITSNL